MLPIRLKIATASTLATLVLLMGAGLIFFTTLRSGLQNSLDNSLRSRSDELVSQVNADGSVRDSVSSGQVSLADNTYGQVLSSSGVILHSTAEKFSNALITTGQIADLTSVGKFFDVSVQGELPGPHPLLVRVFAVPTTSSSAGGAGPVVAVAISREVVDEAVERAGKQLLVVGAIVLLFAAPGSWLLARSALKPVERMRAMAAELQANDAGGGLAVPVTRDEVGRLATTLNELLARLHDALQRERAFVADAGHELRTPLTVLRGELELARRPGRTASELLSTVEIASEETERLIRLAEDLLTLARDEGPEADTSLTFSSHPFDLAAVLDDARALLESSMKTKDVIIDVYTSRPLIVAGAEDRIRQAVDNLLNNALRYSPAGGAITVSAEVVDGWASVEVLDEGPGFNPSFLPVAFERFRRADLTRTRDVSTPIESTGFAASGSNFAASGSNFAASGSNFAASGSGLGLAIVRSILRSHGGEADASNRVGRGARLILRWPVAAGAASGSADAAETGL